MNIDRELPQGAYLAAETFAGRTPTFTIRGHDEAEIVELMKEDGSPEKRIVVHFSDVPKGLVLNRTNRECLKAMFGPDTSAWRGKRLTLHAVEVNVGRERKPGIRILGSPDLAAPITFELRLPRKKAQKVTLQRTSAPAGGAP